MAWIESHQGLERHPKTIMLCSLMNWDLDTCIGKLHRFWWWCLEYCPDGNISRQPAEVIVQSLGLSADSQPTVSRQSAEMSLHNFFMAGFLDKTIEGDLLIHDWLTYVGRYLRDTKYKRQPEKLAAIKKMYEEVELVSRQSADSRRYQPTNLPNTTKPKASKSFPKPRPKKDEARSELNREVWASYKNAFFQRYGVDPVRNAKINGMISKYTQRLPAVEAAAVAAYYVFHQGNLYVQSKHCVDLLLRDAEKLRADWATGTQTTQKPRSKILEALAEANRLTGVSDETEGSPRLSGGNSFQLRLPR